MNKSAHNAGRKVTNTLVDGLGVLGSFAAGLLMVGDEPKLSKKQQRKAQAKADRKELERLERLMELMAAKKAAEALKVEQINK